MPKHRLVLTPQEVSDILATYFQDVTGLCPFDVQEVLEGRQEHKTIKLVQVTITEGT